MDPYGLGFISIEPSTSDIKLETISVASRFHEFRYYYYYYDYDYYYDYYYYYYWTLMVWALFLLDFGP